MNRYIKLWVVVLSLVIGTGCGGLKETFNYQTAARGESRAATASCKTPLRVAVKPFRDARTAREVGTDSFALSMLAGAVLATPAKWELGFDQAKMKSSASYVHDDRRIYAIALWAELADSGCFEEVAFEPLDESEYDLVFSGEIVRFGVMRSTGFVPLPLYVGNLIAVAGQTQQALVEVDLYAHRPGHSDPVLRYGLQGYCDDECSEERWIDAVTTSLRSGHADFIARLSSYLKSRGQSYWVEYAAHRRQEQRRRLDPDLALLERARSSEPGPVADKIAPALAEKHAALDAILAQSGRLERRWSKTSAARVRAEVALSNELVAAVHAERIRAALLAGALSAGTAGASAAVSGTPKHLTPTATNLDRFQKDMQSYQQALLAMGEKPSAHATLPAKTTAEIASIQKARASLASDRKRLLAAYREQTPSTESVLAQARAESAPLPVERPAKSASLRRRKPKQSPADELGY